MTKPSKPPAPVPLWATTVVIPSLWTPAQALAVFDLLNELRDKLWSLYGPQIQTHLREEQHGADAGADANTPLNNNRPF